jgi:hypothetical protein
MGVGTSSLTQGVPAILPGQLPEHANKLILSDNVKARLVQINTLLEYQKANRANELINNVKGLVGDLQIDPKIVPAVEERVNEFVKLMTTRGFTDKGTPDNTALHNYMKPFTDDKLNELKKEIMDEAKTSIVNDPVLQNNIGKFVDDIIRMNTDVRFLEYKYISLNVFMVALIRNIYDAFFQFMEDVKAYNEYRTKVQSASANKLVEKLINIMNNSKLEIDPAKFGDINSNLDALNNQINAWEQVLKEKEDDMQKNFRSVLAAAIDQVERQQQPPQSLNITGGSKNKKKSHRGGYVRDGSRFPDEFFQRTDS